MKLFVTACLALILLGISSCNSTPKGIKVKNLDDLAAHQAELTAHFNKVHLFDEIQGKGDYVFSENRTTSQTFILGKGSNLEGEPIVFRSACQITSIGDFKIIDLLTEEAKGETCSGQGCSQCAFAEDNSCICQQATTSDSSTAFCNHSVSLGEQP